MSNELKFLIGVDGSEDGDEAFNFYARHYHTPEQVAVLVYVVKPLIISSNEMAIRVGEIRQKSMSDEKIKVQQLKDTYEGKMRAHEIRGRINIIYYSKKPGKIICEIAEQERCSAIVIGCRRNGKSSLGPTVDYVLKKARCPVSITRLPSLVMEFADSVSRMEDFHLSRPSASRIRRISCPVICSPPLMAELGKGATGGGGGGVSNGVTNGSCESEAQHQMPKQRRHSVVANVFHHLQATARRKLIPSTDEEDETKC